MKGWSSLLRSKFCHLSPLGIIFVAAFLLILTCFVRSVHAHEVTLVWDPVTHPDLAGYKIYSGFSSRDYVDELDVGISTSYTIGGLQEGETYYFAATAYSIYGEESDFSNEVFSTIPPPGRVAEDLVVLYTFEEGSGQIVHDVSGVGTPLDLVIEDPGSTSWLEGGGLSIDFDTLVASDDAATKIIEACKGNNEITIEAWIRPATTSQYGPARIVTLSTDPSERNFTLGQGLWRQPSKELFDVRLRTTSTGGNGTQPSLSSSEGSLAAELTHVVYTRDRSGVARIYIDGAEVATRSIGGDFSNWDESMPLALANELTRNRPWLGEYHLVAIYARALSPTEIRQNFTGNQ